jgi:hypothetical protein
MGSLREALKDFQFWSLEACVLLGLILGGSLIRELLPRLERRDAWRIGILSAIALALTLFVAERTNRIYYDEQIYQSVGQNLADLKRAQMCNDGSVEYGRLQCASGEYNKQPYAYPHVLSVAYRLFGVQPVTAFVVNAAVMALTVCALYLLVWIVFGDREAAFFSALLITLMPEQIIWSATAAVEPSASLACVVALLAVSVAVRAGTTLAFAAAAVTVAYAVQFRPESFLILPVVALLAWPRIKSERHRPRVYWVGLLFLALVAVHVAHTFAIRNLGWGTDEAPLSVRYVAANWRVNAWFYLADARFPATFTLLAIAGLASRRFKAERAAFALYFLMFFGIGLLFYAGSYNYGADVRYSLMTYPPLAVLGGLGAAQAVRLLEQVTAVLPGRTLLTGVLAFQFLWYAPLVRSTTEEAWAARADVRFAESLSADLKGNAYVLTHNPGMFHVWGVNAGQMSLIASNPAYLQFLASRYTAGVYLHWNFWCNVTDPAHQQLCRKMTELHEVELIREYRERDQRYALYRLQVRAP